jgi:hypothetical protein
MDIKQEFREEKNMDVYAMNVNDGSFSNVYVKWLEAKINYTRCCETLPSKEEVYSSACEYARNVQNPNRNIILTLRQAFKNGAEFIKNKLPID